MPKRSACTLDPKVSPPRRVRAPDALSRTRKRVTMDSEHPPFDRDAASGCPLCNACRLPIRIDRAGLEPKQQDALLRDSMCAQVWREYHWKTFLCAACMPRAVHCFIANMVRPGSHCMSCMVHYAAAEGGSLVMHPTEIGQTGAPTQPRLIPLCAPCWRKYAGPTNTAAATTTTMTTITATPTGGPDADAVS